MNERERLRDLTDYQILDTAQDRELDEIVEIAAAICDTPISLISLIDDTRQWFKSKFGDNVPDESPRDQAFCQHALHTPKEVLVVQNPLEDVRFKDNPFVTGSPNIRFYAGAPLETPKGNVLGTLCILDDKPRTISEKQKKALMLLAKKVMEFLNARKIILQQKGEIELSAEKLRKLTDNAPGVIYQFEMTAKGSMYFVFISKGISTLHPSLRPELIMKNPELAFSVIHKDDIEMVQKSIQTSFENLTLWDIEYRVVMEDGSVSWHLGKANPEKKEDGTVVWYGTFQNISNRKEYEQTLEQIAFDISHVLRRPVTTILGFASLIEKHEMDAIKLKEYSGYIKTVAEELDIFTRKLNETYNAKKLKLADAGK